MYIYISDIHIFVYKDTWIYESAKRNKHAFYFQRLRQIGVVISSDPQVRQAEFEEFDQKHTKFLGRTCGMVCFLLTKRYQKTKLLVGGLEHDFDFSIHIGKFIIPTDQYFSEGWNHQPEKEDKTEVA